MNIPLAISSDKSNYFGIGSTNLAKDSIGQSGWIYDDIQKMNPVMPDAAKPETYSSPCTFNREFCSWKLWNLFKNGDDLVFYTTPDTENDFTKTLNEQGIEYKKLEYGTYEVHCDGKKAFDAIAGDDKILDQTDIDNLSMHDGSSDEVSRKDIFTAVYNNPTTNGQSTLGSLSSSASEIFSKGGELFSGSQLLSLGGELLSGLTGLFE